MNMAAVITAGVFLLVSVCILIFLFVGKGEFAKGRNKNFYRAACGVYVSGVLLVFIFTLIMKGLPVVFVVISDVTVTFVFCMTAGLIWFLTKSIVETANKALETKKREDDKKED